MSQLTYMECLSWLAAWGRGYCDRDELYAAALRDVPALRKEAVELVGRARYEEEQEWMHTDVPPQGRGFWRAYWIFGALLCRATILAIQEEARAASKTRVTKSMRRRIAAKARV